jgi:hypothetical protein
MRTIQGAAIILLSIILSCCHKPAEETSLELSQNVGLRGEPLIAKVVNASAGARFIWKFPDHARLLQFSEDSSLVKFTFSELDNYTYTICVTVCSDADATTGSTFCKEIKADSGKFTPPASLPESVVKSLAGDQLILQPVLYPTDSTMNFIVRTNKKYTCYNSYVLHNNTSLSNNNITMSFNGVWMRSNCEPANAAVISFSHTYCYYKDGNYPVEMTFNNKVYKGSLKVAGWRGYYEFNWPYTEGVVIEPKIIARW